MFFSVVTFYSPWNRLFLNSSMKWERLFCNSNNFINVNRLWAYLALGIFASRHLVSVTDIFIDLLLQQWWFYEIFFIQVWMDIIAGRHAVSVWWICRYADNIYLCLISTKAGLSTGFRSSSFVEMFVFPLAPLTLQDSEYKLKEQDKLRCSFLRSFFLTIGL